MSAPGFTVWVTGAEPDALHAVADEVAARLVARGVVLETLDARSPGLAALAEPVGAAQLAAELLARHGVSTIIALPGSAAARDQARSTLERMIEVHVPSAAAGAPGHEPPAHAEVELAPAELPAGAERVLHTLEILRFLPAAGERGYSEEEERAVIRRLKAFGYL